MTELCQSSVAATSTGTLHLLRQTLSCDMRNIYSPDSRRFNQVCCLGSALSFTSKDSITNTKDSPTLIKLSTKDISNHKHKRSFAIEIKVF
jgi:hypothetical protein